MHGQQNRSATGKGGAGRRGWCLPQFAVAFLMASAVAWGNLAAGQQPVAQPANTATAPLGELAQAQTLVHQGRFADAEAILNKEVAVQPASAEARYLLAYSQLRLNRPGDALRTYTAAAALRPPSSAELVSVGQAYVLLGDFADADKWTLRAVRADPRNAEAWYSLGRIRYTDQHFAEAAACFRKVLELSPRNVKAEDNLGLAFEGMNRTDDAVAAYRQAIVWQDAGPPGSASEQPLLNLSIILLHRGQLADAEPLLRKASSIAPNDPHIHEQLGHLYLQQQNFVAAQQAFQQATHLDPNNSSYHFLLGQAYRHQGRQQEAQVEFAAAARLARKSTTPATP